MNWAVICPGQGSQNVGMLNLLKSQKKATKILDKLDNFLSMPLDDLITHPEISSQNINAQPLICAIQMATWALIKDQLPKPKLFAGYSIGELSAYGCTQTLCVNDVLTLAHKRAKFMNVANKVDTTLITVRGITQDKLSAIDSSYRYEIAIFNSLYHFVIGVESKNVSKFCCMLENLGAKVTVLPVEVASHTKWIAKAAVSFNKELENYSWNNQNIPILAGINGRLVYSKEDAINALSKQLYSPIKWDCCVRSIGEYGCEVVLELGPGRGLSSIVKDLNPYIKVRSVADFFSIDGVVDWVLKNVY